MKRKRLLLIGALVAAAFGLALAGCAQNRLTTDDLIEMGYVNKVTFDLMGGKSGERTELVQYVKDNSLVVEPGSSTLAAKFLRARDIRSAGIVSAPRMRTETSLTAKRGTS